jgi:hypothetical protein
MRSTTRCGERVFAHDHHRLNGTCPASQLRVLPQFSIMNSREGSVDSLVAYEDRPPVWLPRAHMSADIG